MSLRAKGKGQRAKSNVRANSRVRVLFVCALCSLPAALPVLYLHAQDADMQLVEAAMRGDTAQLKTLISAGAKVDAPDSNQRTALTYAAAHGSLPAVQLLLDAGAS